MSETMNLMPTDEQVEIASSSRAFLADRLPTSRIREVIEIDDHAGDPVDDKTWREAAELGWFGLGLPEEAGGIGFGLADEAVLFREIGRSLAPGPYLSTVLGARVAAAGGADALAVDLVAGAGRAGLAVPAGSSELWVLDGGDHVLMVHPDRAALVPTSAIEALTAEPCIDDASRIARGRQGAYAPVAEVTAAQDPIHRRALVLSAALLVGMAEKCRDLCVEHASSREQFGKPIGIHQAVKHPIADMAIRAEAAWPQTVVAACAHDEGRPDADFHALSARIAASGAARDNAAHTVQVMGGMGFTHEHDAHLLVKRAAVIASTLGGDKVLLAQLLAQPPA